MSHDEGLTPSPAMDGASSHVSWGRATGVTSVVIDASDMRRESVMRDLLRVVLSGRDRKWLVRSSGTSTSRSLPHVLTLVLEPKQRSVRSKTAFHDRVVTYHIWTLRGLMSRRFASSARSSVEGKAVRSHTSLRIFS